MDIIEEIRLIKAGLIKAPLQPVAADHPTEALAIFCVDSRIDPLADLGVARGRIHIFRNLGGVIRPYSESKGQTDIGAMLETYLLHMPGLSGRPKHVIVFGHTQCAAMKMCRDHDAKKSSPTLQDYFLDLTEVRDSVIHDGARQNWSIETTAGMMEKRAAQHNMANLQSYPLVRQEMAAGNLLIHCWMFMTGTNNILELDETTHDFGPMRESARTQAVTGKLCYT